MIFGSSSSSAVMEDMITRYFSSRSFVTWYSWSEMSSPIPPRGSICIICFRGPILLIASICLHMSLRVNFPRIRASTSTSSSIFVSWARSMRVLMSPMPRRRDMNRSASNLSRSLGVSPTPMKATEELVSATADMAPPPLAVPSSLVMMTPVIPTALLKAFACSLACWPMAASMTRSLWSAVTTASISIISWIRSSSRACLPAVSTITTSYFFDASRPRLATAGASGFPFSP
ncbi:MAG: hypothetical protein A4E51_00329 [Methanosaeta sp. PtaU1.Bin055]|nr:MAG: hypothetical protein A4E51_00329 [Methanosaeta sp. PtaU1.Bin055]